MVRSFVILILMIYSCSGNTVDPNPEPADPLSRPYFRYDAARKHYLLKPWNYDAPENSQKKYPLVIFLHGMGGAGDISYLNFLGYDTDDGVDDTAALGFQKRHPSFVLVPQTDAGEWDGHMLTEEGEFIKNTYRIDTKRIYLIGYSMGGSGSYIFANAWYDYNKSLFAGIIRLVGQSQTVVRDSIAQRTAIWLHIGLLDSPLRLKVVKDAYNFLKNYNINAVETVKDTVISGYPAKIYTLNINNDDKIKMTEYSGVGHGILNAPFRDNHSIDWLFRHTL